MTEFIQKYVPLSAGQIASIAEKLLRVLVIFILAHLLVTVVRKAILGKKKKILHVDADLVPTLRGTISTIIYVVAVFMSLDVFGVISHASLITVLGSLGLGVGFATKDLIANFITGITLLVTRPFSMGDFIDCNINNRTVSGTVCGVAVLETKLETIDGLIVSIPNQLIWSSPVINYSKNEKRRLVFPLLISYGESMENAMRALSEVLAEEPRFLSTPEPMIIVASTEEHFIRLELRTWTQTEIYWDVYYDVMHKVRIKASAYSLQSAASQHLIINKDRDETAVKVT